MGGRNPQLHPAELVDPMSPSGQAKAHWPKVKLLSIVEQKQYLLRAFHHHSQSHVPEHLVQ